MVADAIHCISARLTIGNGIEIANASDLHSIFALVNLETGVVFSEGCDNEGRRYKNHPQTGKNIKGFTIPNWNRVIDTVKRAAAEIPEIGYIGWDIAVTENGAVLIEGNNDPGYTAYQLPKLTGTHIGAKLVIEKYIKL